MEIADSATGFAETCSREKYGVILLSVASYQDPEYISRSRFIPKP